MNKHRFAVLATLFLLVVLGSLPAACGGPSGESSSGATEDRALLQERCTKCHDLGQVKRARKTEAEWKGTVRRMVGKGAELNRAEQEAVIQYLTETYRP